MPPVSPRGPKTEDEILTQHLLSIDQKLFECHVCGKREELHIWRFGLGKIITKKRNWGQTAMSAAISAVTLPAIGFGVLSLPSKNVRIKVLKLQLNLCDRCARTQKTSYALHPWWDHATRLGYTEFLTEQDLRDLRYSLTSRS